MSDFDFSDINLDFLQSTPPRGSQETTRAFTPIVKNELGLGDCVAGGKKTKSKKRLEWAKRIATVDQLQKEIQMLKSDKLELQTQLKEFQKSAMAIQNLYTAEKASSDEKSSALQDLREKFERLDADLTVKNLKCDQLEGQLAVHKERPVDYNVLVVKYLRVLNKLDEEDCVRNCADRSLVDNLRQYCTKYKLKVPQALSPKKTKSRFIKLQKEDVAVQCDTMQEMSAAVKPVMRCQSTQTHIEMRSQGTQHIGTMTTRSTTTSCFIQFRSVGTSSTDLQSVPVVDEILKEFAPWQNITPVTPLADQPAGYRRPSRETTKSFKTIGTCTWLCNVRRPIDFTPRNKCQRLQNEGSGSQNIKQEVTTPSTSPTPNVQTNAPNCQNNNTVFQPGLATANHNSISNPLLNSLHTSLPLGRVTGSSFDDLWNIFGRMILGLLQSSNAVIATNSSIPSSTTNQEAVNQHQFQNWLRQLYENSVIPPANRNSEQGGIITTDNIATCSIPSNEVSPTAFSTNISQPSSGLVFAQSENLANNNVIRSPIHFNETSPFSLSNIVRPQARRGNANELQAPEVFVVSNSDCQEDTHPHNNPMNSTTVSIIDTHSCGTNLTTATDNGITHHHLPQSLSSNLIKEISTQPKASAAKSTKKKQKNGIISEIQELFPEAKLNKSRKKALKRILKTRKHKRKSCLSTRTSQLKKQLTIKASDEASNKMETKEETAVDFLKGIFEGCNSNSANNNYAVHEKSENLTKPTDEELVQLYQNTSMPMLDEEDKLNSGQMGKGDSVQNYKIVRNIENAISKKEIPFNKMENLDLPTSQVNVYAQRCLTSNTGESLPHFKELDNISKSFSFLKPSGVCRKLKVSKKKAQYTLLFGDSDTETEESEDDRDSCNVGRKTSSSLEDLSTYLEVHNSKRKISLSILEDSENEHDNATNLKAEQTSIGSPNEIKLECSKIIGRNEKKCLPGKKKEPNLTQSSAFNEAPIDFSQQNKISVPDIVPPDREKTKKSFIGTKGANLLIDQMNKNSQKSPIRQLGKLPSHNSEDKNDNQTSEEFPNVFATDIELFSVDELGITSNLAEIYTENLKNSLPVDLNNKFENTVHGSTVNVKSISNSCNEEVVLTVKESNQETKEFNDTTLVRFGILKETQDNADMKGMTFDTVLDHNDKTNPLTEDQSRRAVKSPTENTSVQIEVSTSSSSTDGEVSVTEISSDIASIIENVSNDDEGVGSKNHKEVESPGKELLDTCAEVINSSDKLETDIDGSYENNTNEELPSKLFSNGEISNVIVPGGIMDARSTNNITLIPNVELNTVQCDSNYESFTETQITLQNQETVRIINFNKEDPNRPTIHTSKNAETLIECNTVQPMSCSDDEISALDISTDSMNFKFSTIDTTNTSDEKLLIDEHAKDSDQEISENEQQHKESQVNIPTSSTNNATHISQNSKKDLVKCHKRISNTPPNDKNRDLSTPNANDSSALLSSSLYKEILTDSLYPLVDEVLCNGDLMLISHETDEKSVHRGRKRKSESQPEEQISCKRSQRLRDKKMVMEQSFNLGVNPIDIGKYARVNNRCIYEPAERNAKKQLTSLEETKGTENMIDMPKLKMGFFREINESKAKEDCKHSGCLETVLKLNEVHKEGETCSIMRSTFNEFAAIDNNESRESGKNSENTNRDNYPCHMRTTPSIENSSFHHNSPQNFSNSDSFDYSDSPLSPVYDDTIEDSLNTTTLEISLELSPECRPRSHHNSLLETLVENYNTEHFSRLSTNTRSREVSAKRQEAIMNHYERTLTEYCCNIMELDPDIMASRAVDTLREYSMQSPLLCSVILKLAKFAEPSKVKESDLPSIIQEMPPRHLSLPLKRLYYLLKQLTYLNGTFCKDLREKIESFLFNCQQTEKTSLNGILHLTQLYLMACKLHQHQLDQHPARMFISKCLYFHSIKATSMIHEVLMWYPTALPPKEDRTYDRSDPIITVIQQVLMSTKYDMENSDIRGRSLISKLRYEYHYMPYKPLVEDVVRDLVEKIKTSKFYNIRWSFSVLCKRLQSERAEKLVLQAHLLPLANEYFNEALNNTTYDSRLAVILEIISVTVKPFPQDWSVEVYLNLFSRFLNNFNRPIIQETAACCILRLQRFGYVNCFNRLRSFKPTYELSALAQAMFKTFVHRKPLPFLKKVAAQNRINWN